MKAWSKEELRKIAEADDLHISPFREDGTTYGTPTWIWAVKGAHPAGPLQKLSSSGRGDCANLQQGALCDQFSDADGGPGRIGGCDELVPHLNERLQVPP